MLPLIVDYKICHKECGVHGLKCNAVKERFQLMHVPLNQPSFPALMFSNFSQNRVLGITHCCLS